ncbi:MAG: hypothetical protein ACR2LQ_01590 [Acidimicrobiales bacterium]
MRGSTPLRIAGAAFVAAGAYIHMNEWLDTYRHTPSDVPGSWVVRIGFLVDVAISVVAVAALLFTALRRARWATLVAVAVLGFQAGALATLILSRTGSVFQWMEPVWTDAAEQSRAVEIGALVSIAGALVLSGLDRRVRRSTNTRLAPPTGFEPVSPP